MQRLFLVRHGPTHAKGMIGWSDLPADLSDTEALARLARWLPSDAHVVSSDLIRTVATADAITGERTRLPHHVALREMHFGAWENRTWRDVDGEHPDLLRAFYEDPGKTAPPGGESWHDLGARVSPAIDTLLNAAPSDLIVVCHFGVILSQIQRATGQSAYDTFARRIDNLSVSVIEITQDGWHADSINHTP